MDDEELRARLRRADPARDDQPAASWIDDLVEATMDTELDETPRTDRRRWVVPAAAAAAVLAVAGGAFALAGGDDPDRGKDPEPRTELALVLPAADPMQMCVQFDVETLRPMETAFAATATEVEGEQVTLEVDRWYKGGDADIVTLTSPADVGVLLEGGVAFAEGERYLVTATGDTINGCGFSGPWTEEMAAAYEEAF